MDYDVNIIIAATNKPGVLSKVIREIGHYGLICTGQNIRQENDLRIIEFRCTGKLHCAKDRLISALEDITEVNKIIDIIVSSNQVFGELDKADEAFITATQPLSPSVILAAEKQLSSIVGPVATYLVEQASKTCQNAGELFLELATELDTNKERDELMSVVQDLNLANK